MTIVDPIRRVSPRDLINRLLERGYSQAALPIIRRLTSEVAGGRVQQRLIDLQTEAARLALEGKRLTPDNAYIAALYTDLDRVLRIARDGMSAAGSDLQGVGIRSAGTLTRELALPQYDDVTLARLGIRWNTPDPNAIAAAITYTDNPLWASTLNRYGEVVIKDINSFVLNGFVRGWGPEKLAKGLIQMVQGYPAYKANNLMRTLMLQSYRQATALHHLANADIIEYQIRIGTLDQRICPLCLALHGTISKVGTVIEAHYQCRCTTIAKVKGIPRTVQTGQAWFDEQPEAVQLQIAGPQLYDLLKRGAVTLADTVGSRNDPLFGRMLARIPIKDML